MKSFDSRAYSINDFLEWDRNKQLELNPRWQRRSVWTDNARSYLMDTIVRGKPIPKVFIRQKLNPTTKSSIREVVDGQQRLRTILSYLKDGFQISKRHNPQYGGMYFSQLGHLDDEVQANILNYEIAVDLLVNMPDPEILDVFSRLNSYAVILNEQERLNADHFGPFKSLADQLGHKFYDFWIANRILTDAQILRMGDAGLAADLLIAMIEGIKSKKQIKNYYDLYERKFDEDVTFLADKFEATLKTISDIFGDSLRTSQFRRIQVFYSLFTAVYHLHYGLKDINLPCRPFSESEYSRVRNALETVEIIFPDPDASDAEDKRVLDKAESRFLEDSRRATTDAAVRVRRTQFIVERILSHVNT